MYNHSLYIFYLTVTFTHYKDFKNSLFVLTVTGNKITLLNTFNDDIMLIIGSRLNINNGTAFLLRSY